MSLVPERTTQNYGPGVTTASKAVLLELMATLRVYRDALVLVGGWVPYFLLEQHRPPEDDFEHVGSIDIDLAVDPEAVREPEYGTIVELLTARGYRPTPDRRGSPIPYSFDRVVRSPLNNKTYTIRVDFLTHLDDPRSGRHTSRQVQDDLFARKTKGCDAAFQHFTQFDLTGELPEGGKITVPIRMADVVGCLTMKGIVLGERYREKDAYDIYAVAAHYEGGPRDVAEALRPYLQQPLLGESLQSIRAAFGERSGNGPAWVAAFLVSHVFSAERERLVTEAHMVVSELLRVVEKPLSAAGAPAMERNASSGVV